ncbi:hypothetical protein [Reinekea thalattae]|uniref:Uncharacterized protein n=1 Tax=Reinekea thalattae TaxID=2593301 RepID=A0A5C8Z286_9GAMM|nr:hypothetical protein [Reinekea thalattae]TXR51414.1 hypothetical protein FME95_12880 [Reinekea thalattae]
MIKKIIEPDFEGLYMQYGGRKFFLIVHFFGPFLSLMAFLFFPLVFYFGEEIDLLSGFFIVTLIYIPSVFSFLLLFLYKKIHLYIMLPEFVVFICFFLGSFAWASMYGFNYWFYILMIFDFFVANSLVIFASLRVCGHEIDDFMGGIFIETEDGRCILSLNKRDKEGVLIRSTGSERLFYSTNFGFLTRFFLVFLFFKIPVLLYIFPDFFYIYNSGNPEFLKFMSIALMLTYLSSRKNTFERFVLLRAINRREFFVNKYI